jgi:hypothetical protein
MCCSICSIILLSAPAPPAIMAPNFIPASIDCRASSGMCRRHATRNSRTCPHPPRAAARDVRQQPCGPGGCEHGGRTMLRHVSGSTPGELGCTN